MDISKELIQGLSDFAKRRNIDNLSLGKVLSVDVQNAKCKCQVGDFGISVSLMAAPNVTNAFLAYPSVGSYVTIGIVGSRWYLVGCSEIDKVSCIVGTTKFEVSNNGVLIKKGNETLKSVLISLVSELQLSFSQINAVIGVPANTPNYQTILTKINSLFT